jgi:hypothetical protein
VVHLWISTPVCHFTSADKQIAGLTWQIGGMKTEIPGETTERGTIDSELGGKLCPIYIFIVPLHTTVLKSTYAIFPGYLQRRKPDYRQQTHLQ